MHEVMSHDIYQDPLVGRYTSREMQELFSDKRTHETWRTCWIALAQAQQELGLSVITDQMISEMQAARTTIDYELVAAKEREIRHDVMAHIYEFGTHCPTAKGIIHLGATSQFVNDNTQLLQMKKGVQMIHNHLVQVIANMAQIAREHKDMVTLGFTHFQPAQPTTVGKRMTLYIQDLLMDLDALESVQIPARGAKGTTGTQASFLELFQGDYEKVQQLDRLVAKKLGFDTVFPVTSQTYPRKFDTKIAEILAGIAVSLSKFATDIRLLAHQKVVDETFAVHQTGSSAMAYKRNPMRSERVCSLSRKVIGLVQNFYSTATAQWLERTLDDSAIRRMDIPQLFLGTEAILLLARDITHQDVDPNRGRPLTFYPHRMNKLLLEELPYMCTEAILMDLVKQGYDRQHMHELIKEHSVACEIAIKETGTTNDLFARLGKDDRFPLSEATLQTYLTDPHRYAGAAAQQTEAYLTTIVRPRLARYQLSSERGETVSV